jgi:hypothetical protein
MGGIEEREKKKGKRSTFEGSTNEHIRVFAPVRDPIY